MKVDVYIEGERLDLKDDFSISITQGVQDVKDISKLFADYSQTFVVPATDNNNRIFKHYYNADIDGGFDARTRKLATIDVNTLDFKRGKIQLESVDIEDNQPKYYRITFFGNAIKVKDLIGDDKLFSLDWLDNFNHDYDETVVQNGLTTGIDFTVDGVLYEKAIVYPLISYDKQYEYDSSSSNHTNTDSLVNIRYHSGHSGNNHGVDFSDLKPAIKLSLIVKAIEEKYNFNFTGGFFDSPNFKEIYMSLNNSTTKLNTGFLLFEDKQGDSPVESALSDDRLVHRTIITPKAGFETVPYSVKMVWNGQEIYNTDLVAFGTSQFTGVIQSPQATYDIQVSVSTESDFEFDATTSLDFRALVVPPQIIYQETYVDQVIDLEARINNLMYDIKTYEFLTSLFKMFNLVVLSDGDDIVIESLQQWYQEGNIYDISEYVDKSKLKVAKGKVYSEINFKFEDSDQVLADEYNQNFRRYYGNLEEKIYADETQTDLIDGDALDIDVIFENPIFERLTDQNTGELTTIQYCPYFDRSVDSISGNPFLFYVDDVNISTNSISFLGISSETELNSTIIMPSHQRQINQAETFSLNFNVELSEYIYENMIRNIFTEYYQDYIGDIFSIKRRNYDLKAILPDSLLHNLKLNDRFIIDDNRYIINKITSNIVNREDSFELINDIYEAPLLTDRLNSGTFTVAGGFFGNLETSDMITFVGDTRNPITIFDMGFGTSWVSIDSDLGTGLRNIIFSITENTTSAVRIAQIRIENDDKSIAKFTIQQSE